MKDIIIVGHGGLAREVAQYISDINKVSPRWVFKGFSTANPDSMGEQVGDHQVSFLDEYLLTFPNDINVAIAIGFPQILSKLTKYFSPYPHIQFPNLIHPHIYMSDTVKIGKGNIIVPGVVMSVDIEIGSFNLFDWNVTIGHDCVIGDCNTFLPSCNISGVVRIGSRVMVGAGAQILPGLSVTDDVIIGAGAVVTKSIEEPGTYIGIPAKKYKSS